MEPTIIAFDFGHTVMDETSARDVPLPSRPFRLIPGVLEMLPRLAFPLALWANTRVATEADVLAWLERAGLNHLFGWVVTSVDARARKPAPQFFDYALARCGFAPQDVLFVGNQLNTDVAGGVTRHPYGVVIRRGVSQCR